MVSDVYVMVKRMITGVFGSLFDSNNQVKPVAYTNADKARTLMQFRHNALFKGHSGSICIYDDELVIHNKYYSGICIQTIHKDFVDLTLQNMVDHPKWLMFKLEEISNDLKHLMCESRPSWDEEFILKFDGVTYRLQRTYACITFKHNIPKREMYGHWDALRHLKSINYTYSRLKKVLKSMPNSELVNMFTALHEKSNKNWIISEELIR